jgi:hypothetical protein
MISFIDCCRFFEVASEPASGSDKQKAPITSPFATRYFIFALHYSIFL